MRPGYLAHNGALTITCSYEYFYGWWILLDSVGLVPKELAANMTSRCPESPPSTPG